MTNLIKTCECVPVQAENLTINLANTIPLLTELKQLWLTCHIIPLTPSRVATKIDSTRLKIGLMANSSTLVIASDLKVSKEQELVVRTPLLKPN
jgi:hypothetical protein